MNKNQTAFIIKLIQYSDYTPSYKEQKFLDSIMLIDWNLSWRQDKYLKAIHDKSTKKG